MKAGWEVRPLGEVCAIQNGGTPKSNIADYWGDEVPWLTPKDMGQQELAYVADTPRKITQLGLSKCSAKLVPVGSVIMSTRAPIGHLSLNTVPMAFNQGCRGITPSERLDLKYLFYFLTASVEPLQELGTGATFKELSAGALKGFEIPIPPLEEQKRIVTVLDAAFEGLTRAKENAEANLQNARELFSRYLSAAYIKACEKWPQQALGEALDNITYGFTNPMPDTDEGPFKVTAKNVVGGRVDLSTAKHTSLEAFETLLTDKSRPKIGDVLITKDGTLGRTAVVEIDGLCINQSVAVMRPKPHLSSNFLRMVLSEQTVQERLIDDADGATIKHLYITRIPKVRLGIPSHAEQRQFLERMNEFRRKSDLVIEKYEAKLTDITDLRQSLLQKAFAGELT